MRRDTIGFRTLGLVLLAACSGDVVLPPSPLTPPARRSSAVNERAPDGLVANDVRYRDTGLPVARGRSGSATIVARALLGRDNITLLEVSTGDPDQPVSATGILEKVQIRTFGVSDGKPGQVENVRPAARGSWSHSYPALVRGQRLQVQANVSGIDPRRTDVVTVDGYVKWRPDLRAELMVARRQVLVGDEVVLLGEVREMNGDVGARADCVLYANGAVIDRADGIWVDRADAVTCVFRTRFATAGTRHLEVRLERVAPGDYDVSNNTAAATLEVLDPAASFTGTASASNSVTGRELASGSAARFPFPDTYTLNQTRAVATTLDATFDFPDLGSAQVMVSRESEGRTFGAATVQLDVYGGCGIAVPRNQLIFLCAQGAGRNSLLWTTTQTSVAYWSFNNLMQWNGTQFVYSPTGLAPDAPPQPEAWGRSLILRVTVAAGGRTISASPVVPLASFDEGTVATYACTPTGCSGSHDIRYGVRGRSDF